MHNTKAITLVNLLLELQPFEHGRYWKKYTCPLCKLKTVPDILMKLHTHVKHNEQGTEHKNHNSDLPLFGNMALWTLKIVFSVIYLCPLCNLKTVWDIFLKLYTNVYHHDGLGGSVWCALRLETRRSWVQPPPRSATFFHGDWSQNIFYSHSLPSTDSRKAVVSFWRKNVHYTGNHLED